MAGAAPYALAGLPSLIGLTQKRPKAPRFVYSGPDRSAYIDRLLESSFNPQSELYRLATDQAMENINRTLANRGLMDSSLGLQQVRAGSADLANKFLEGELARRQNALESARSFDALRAGIDQSNYAAEKDRYASANEANQNMLSGIANMIGTGWGMYNQNRTNNQINDIKQLYSDALSKYSGVPTLAPFQPMSSQLQMPQPMGPYNLGR